MTESFYNIYLRTYVLLNLLSPWLAYFSFIKGRPNRVPEVEGPDVDRRLQHAGRQVARTGKSQNIQFWFYFGHHQIFNFGLFYLERDGVGVELVIKKFFIFYLNYLDWDDEVGGLSIIFQCVESGENHFDSKNKIKHFFPTRWRLVTIKESTFVSGTCKLKANLILFKKYFLSISTANLIYVFKC